MSAARRWTCDISTVQPLMGTKAKTQTQNTKLSRVVGGPPDYCGETLHVPGLEGGFGTHFLEPATTLF